MYNYSILIWLVLMLSVVAVFTKQNKLAIIFLAASLIFALIKGHINATALLIVLVGLAVSYKTPNLKGFWKLAGFTFIIIWCFALYRHNIAGFYNLKVLDSVTKSINSAPFTMYLNLDKPMIIFGLLLAYPALLGNKSKLNLKVVGISMALLLLLLPIASLAGALKLEFGLPNWWLIFALNNLLLVSVAEEAFFRGFIQQALQKRFGWKIGLIVASTLFGLAHYAGGLPLIVFASLAGLFYGLVFYFSSRLYMAVFAHFLFNFAHLVFFTYPMLLQ